MDEVLDGHTMARERQSYEHIQVTSDGDIMRITLNRPAATNALSQSTLEELTIALDDIELNDRVKVVVFCGNDKAFCSGLDVAEHTDENVYQLLDGFHQVIQRIHELEAVSLAIVKGMALGAGCELAATCDICLTSDDAKLGQPEIKAGLFPSVGPVIYPPLIGLHRTYEMILTGRIYEAREAERIGLTTRALPSAQLDAEAERWIEFLRSFSTPVLRLARRAVADASNLPFEEGLKLVGEVYLNQLVSTEDAKEGVRALRERRQPKWKHR